MTFDYRIEALTVWPFEMPRVQRNPSFSAGYPDTLGLLARELRELGTRGTVVFQLVTDGRSVRRDGMLRSDAKVTHPGIAIAFACRHGNLIYPCATYGPNYKMAAWQANLRAIALSLEALRAADRHGVAGRGQQYRGWLAIEAARSSEEPLPFYDADTAYQWLAAITGTPAPQTADGRAAVVRIAKRETHPDRTGGDQTTWDQVEQAVALMRSAGMVDR